MNGNRLAGHVDCFDRRIAQLTSEGLIDEYQLVVNPIVLGKGRTMFDGLKKQIPMKMTRTRPFHNGKVVLCYEPN